MRGSPACPGPGRSTPVRAFLDTNILIRHLTGDPPRLAVPATRYLASAPALPLTGLATAEVACVLESVLRVAAPEVARLLRPAIAFPSIDVAGSALLLRTLEVCEVKRPDFADAYLVACAEASGIGVIASFDRNIDRVGTVQRIEP
ncbi:MAG: PIN domain-containing protein [Actinomycetota bacterium]